MSDPTTAPAYTTRRTFAIISHPDAGKTTLTEKLLLFSGSIQMAGHVRARGENRRTRSDWLDIERARGISVSSSVMTFEHMGATCNLLDTPGHADFSEDTYRTLSAVDAAVMVVDAAKGIESQTRKLFEVCRLRDIPIVTFINKVDREGVHPLEILDTLAGELALDLCPMVWPVGMGSDFCGTLDLTSNEVRVPEGPQGLRSEAACDFADLNKPGRPQVNPRIIAQTEEEAELAREGLPAFDRQSFLEGHLSPVFFGSALKNFGVAELLAFLCAQAPGALPRPAAERTVSPEEAPVTGFVFKIQANMDPNHRDRVAFMRIVSGEFRRGMKLLHVRSGKQIAITAPIFFFAQNREVVDVAVAGDIIGIPNHGTFRIGDTLTEGETLAFSGIPSFAPEVLRRVLIDDTTKTKQFYRGLQDLAEEGVAQIFRMEDRAEPIVGVAGALQLDVLGSRMVGEYRVGVRFEDTDFTRTRWVTADNKEDLDAFVRANKSNIATDPDGRVIFMATGNWQLNKIMGLHKEISFRDIAQNLVEI